jgi:beta-galactosidase
LPHLPLPLLPPANQIENEYGFCGDDKSYLRSLASIVRTHLSDRVLLFTTDPPGVAPRGTLAGEEVYTVVDFGPGGWGW